MALILKGNIKASISCSKISMKHFQTYFHSLPSTTNWEIQANVSTVSLDTRAQHKRQEAMWSSGQVVTICPSVLVTGETSYQLSPGLHPAQPPPRPQETLPMTGNPSNSHSQGVPATKNSLIITEFSCTFNNWGTSWVNRSFLFCALSECGLSIYI